MALQLKYPVKVDTDEKKLAYCTRAREIVRLVHNIGKAWLEGITRDEYDNGIATDRLAGTAGRKVVLSTDMKAAFPFKGRITSAERTDWTGQQWEPRWRVIENDIGELRERLKNSTTYDADIDLDNL